MIGEGICHKCICVTIYTLSKGSGHDKLAMSCTYSFFRLSGKFEMIFIEVISKFYSVLLILEEK